MASNNLQNQSSSEEFINRILEKAMWSVKIDDGSSKAKRTVAPCATSTESEALKNHIAAEKRPIHIENNYGLINITRCSKCSSDSTEASDVAVVSKLPSVNVNITNNNGIVICCDKIEEFGTKDREMADPGRSASSNDNLENNITDRSKRLEMSSYAGNHSPRRG